MLRLGNPKSAVGPREAIILIGHSWPEALESKSSGAVVFKLDICDTLIVAI